MVVDGFMFGIIFLCLVAVTMLYLYAGICLRCRSNEDRLLSRIFFGAFFVLFLAIISTAVYLQNLIKADAVNMWDEGIPFFFTIIIYTVVIIAVLMFLSVIFHLLRKFVNEENLLFKDTLDAKLDKFEQAEKIYIEKKKMEEMEWQERKNYTRSKSRYFVTDNPCK